MADKRPIILTEEQKQVLLNNWDKMKYVDLVKLVFKDDKLDGRSFEGKAIRDFLGEDRKPLSSAYEKKQAIELSEEDKELINNNCRFSTANELARNIFKNQGLTPLSLETRTVLSYIKTLPEEVSGKNYHEDVATEDYSPPSTIRQMIALVNQYCLKNFEYDKLNSQQKKMFENLLSLFKSPRYLQMIQSYSSKSSRSIFEGEFTRAVFDKPDIVSDELNLIVNLCWNYLSMIKINRQLDLLNERYEQVVSDPDSKISMTLVEMINTKNKEISDCDSRQQKLIKDLNGSRSERKKNEVQQTISVASLVEWFKTEEERDHAIRRAELRKVEVDTELKRLEDMPDLKCRLLNFTRSELLQG